MRTFVTLLALTTMLLLAACDSASGTATAATEPAAASLVGEATGGEAVVDGAQLDVVDDEMVDVENADDVMASVETMDHATADVATAGDEPEVDAALEALVEDVGETTLESETSSAIVAMPADVSELPPVECLICDVDLASYAGPLSEDEIMGLLLALNDEYHAWAVYGQVIADFGQVRPFTNIQRSEASHIAALERLFVAYELPLPANPWPGSVESFASVTEACQVGVDAEIVNRELYDRLFASTDREDIIAVYTALQRASDENHLPAFERCAGR